MIIDICSSLKLAARASLFNSDLAVAESKSHTLFISIFICILLFSCIFNGVVGMMLGGDSVLFKASCSLCICHTRHTVHCQTPGNLADNRERDASCNVWCRGQSRFLISNWFYDSMLSQHWPLAFHKHVCQANQLLHVTVGSVMVSMTLTSYSVFLYANKQDVLKYAEM